MVRKLMLFRKLVLLSNPRILLYILLGIAAPTLAYDVFICFLEPDLKTCDLPGGTRGPTSKP
jgi:hypothetical protein